MTTPLDIAVQRELADLRDEITRRPPALVSLDALDRLATAVEALTRAIAGRGSGPIGYTVARRVPTGAVVIDAYQAHGSVEAARAEMHGDEFRGLFAFIVALVPVEVAP